MKMDDIKHVQLSEIAELITKGTTPTTLGYEFQDSGENFLKIECLDENGVFIKSKVAHISEECHEKLKRSQLKDGDILFSIAGAIGRVAIVTEEMLPANTNQALAIIRITNEEVYLPYIKLILTSTIVKDQFEKKKQGVAQLNLSLKDINEISIPLPNIEKQIELAELFGKVANVIAKRNEEIKSLDELIKARFVELFGDENNSYGWDIVNVEDVADVQVGVVIKPAQYYTDSQNGIKTFRSLNVGPMYIKDNDWVYFTEEGNNKNAKSILKENDLLIVRSGAPGTACVVSKEYEGCNAIDIIIAHPHLDKVNPHYLCAYTNLPHGKKQIEEGTGGAAQQHFNVGKYNKLKLMLPPMDKQEEFVVFMDQIDKSKFNDMITEDYYSRENSRCRDNVFFRVYILHRGICEKTSLNYPI